MVTIFGLWLPILLSAILCFFMSSLVHMIFKWHSKDHQALPNEDAALKALRDAGISKGSYVFPFPGKGKSWTSPEMAEKYAQGPMGFLEVMPLGPPQMGKSLMKWFIYLLVVGAGVAWVLSLTMVRGADYILIFRTVALTSGLAYVVPNVVPSIWRGQTVLATSMFILDGILYSLLTAGAFSWLWPR
jgi:hypothetical protein